MTRLPGPSGAPQPLGVHIYSTNYAPEVAGIGPYAAELAEFFVGSLGVSARVTTTVPHYPEWRTDPKYDGIRRVAENLNGVAVERVRPLLLGKSSFASRAAFELSFLALAFRCERPRENDIVLGYSPGLSSAVLAALGRGTKERKVLVVQDLLGAGIAQSTGRTPGFMSKGVAHIEGWALKRADVVVAVSGAFVPYLAEMGVDPDRIRVLSNWRRQPARSDEARREYFRSKLARGCDTLVLHTGALGRKQGLDQLVDAARQANESRLSVAIALVGSGAERDHLERQAGAVPNLSIVEPVSERDYGSLLSSADVLVVSQAPSNVDMSFPSKIGSYAGADRPIIAWVPAAGSVARYFRAVEGGAVVPSGDVESFLLLAAHPQNLQRPSARLLSDWDSSSLLSRWAEAILEVPVRPGGETSVSQQ